VKEKSENRRVIVGDLMVGLGGLEPPTSPLSGARSSHLSYRPTRSNRLDSETNSTMPFRGRSIVAAGQYDFAIIAY
jgi:hypothetical protein